MNHKLKVSGGAPEIYHVLLSKLILSTWTKLLVFRQLEGPVEIPQNEKKIEKLFKKETMVCFCHLSLALTTRVIA